VTHNSIIKTSALGMKQQLLMNFINYRFQPKAELS